MDFQESVRMESHWWALIEVPPQNRAESTQVSSASSDHCITVVVFLLTTLQSIMNANLSQHRFWQCHENRLNKTIQTIPQNLCVSFKLTSLYCGLRLILVYPNP